MIEKEVEEQEQQQQLLLSLSTGCKKGRDGHQSHSTRSESKDKRRGSRRQYQQK